MDLLQPEPSPQLNRKRSHSEATMESRRETAQVSTPWSTEHQDDLENQENSGDDGSEDTDNDDEIRQFDGPAARTRHKSVRRQ